MRPLDQLPLPNLSARRIYAYKLRLAELESRIKVGETERSVRTRVKEQVNTAGLGDLVEILMDKPAVTREGRPFRDTEVHEVLKGMPNVTHLDVIGGVEWFECSIQDVVAAYNTVHEGQTFDRPRDRNFELRDEQRAAIEAAHTYFAAQGQSPNAAPRFLWNAKMRFGKTFAAYHLAKQRNAARVLVVTYKPAVEASWREDLETHIDFDGWVFFSRSSTLDPESISDDVPLVCFASLQDLRGTGEDGAIKDHNQWIHDTAWDLVVVDEYHYGAWNEATKQLLQGEIGGGAAEYSAAKGEDEDPSETRDVATKVGVNGAAYLCLSGTPFRAIASQEFGDEQIFNWTYTDEQREKEAFFTEYPGTWNPYGALPKMHLLVYELPPSLREVAMSGSRNEFDLNEFFRASGSGSNATFDHKDQVQAWLQWLRGQDLGSTLEALEAGTAKPFPYADTNVLPYMSHTVWFLPGVAAVFAMKNLLEESFNANFWGEYTVKAVAGNGPGVGVGAAALPPVTKAIGDGFDTKTITLTCGKLLTGVTVPQWSSILMLNNLGTPESYFQAAFRVQSPWSIWNPEGDDPNEERVVKPACLVVDFAPTRALRLFAEYGMRLGEGVDADRDVRDLHRFLPVLGFDGTQMREIHVDEIIDAAFESTSIDARRMSSKVFIDANLSKLEGLNEDVRRALALVTRPTNSPASSAEGETVINVTDELEHTSGGINGDGTGPSAEEDGELQLSEVEERLLFLSSRINAFMYLSEVVEKNLTDVLDTDEEELFRTVMELAPSDMDALVMAGLFNEQAMRFAIHQFRRADEASFSYTGLNPRELVSTESTTAIDGLAEAPDAN